MALGGGGGNVSTGEGTMGGVGSLAKWLYNKLKDHKICSRKDN